MQEYVEERFDLTGLTPEDCALYLRKNNAVLFQLLLGPGRVLAKGGDESKISVLPQTPQYAWACYVKAKQSVQQQVRPLPTETLSSVAMAGHKVSVFDGTISTSMVLYDGEEPTIEKVPPYVDSTSIVVELGEAKAFCQSVKGEVVLTPQVANMVGEVLQAKVVDTRPEEVLISARIADLFTHRAKKGFELKKLMNNKGVEFPEEDIVKLVEAGGVLTTIFTPALSRSGVGIIKGRQLMGRVQSLMEDYRTNKGYKPTIKKLNECLLCPFRMLSSKSMGEDTPGSLGYSYKFRDAMRAIRGEDKKDSTFVSTSIYLPYNMSRVYAKHAMRVHDIYRIVSLIETKCVNIVGKAASSYVDSLILFAVGNITSIGILKPRVAGWNYDATSKTASREGVSFTLTNFHPDWYTINVDLESISEPWLATPHAYADQDSVIQMVPIVPKALETGRLLLCGALHTLNGFWLPLDLKRKPLKNEGEVYKAADELNLYMTFYSLLKKDRPKLLYTKIPGLVVHPGVVVQLSKKLTAITRVELETQDFSKIEDLVMTPSELHRLEQAAADHGVKHANEEPEAQDEDDEEEADSGEKVETEEEDDDNVGYDFPVN